VRLSWLLLPMMTIEVMLPNTPGKKIKYCRALMIFGFFTASLNE